MRVFVTGATGFVGTAVVRELLQHGHEVLGLARSEESASALRAMGAQVQRGSLQEVESLRAGATASDAVIHCAFIHDFSNFVASTEADRHAIREMGMALEGTGRPLIVTAGSLLVKRRGAQVTEEDPADPDFPRTSEQSALAFVDCGVRVSVVRLPPSVHGEGDHGFIPFLIGLAREKGLSAYVGEGRNRWPAVHRLDAARLYRLVLEKGAAGAVYQAIGDEGVPFRDIAEVIGRRLSVPVKSVTPEKAQEHFGWMALFAGTDGPASSAITRKQLGWEPNEHGLLADIDDARYFKSEPQAPQTAERQAAGNQNKIA